MTDDLCRALDPYVDPPAPQPTIDLRRCKPGDRVKFRDGSIGGYVGMDNDPDYPHDIERDDCLMSGHAHNGYFGMGSDHEYDVVEIIGLTPSTNQSATEETLKAEFLQHLYAKSGRTCSTFSGLWAEFRQQCLQEHLDALAEQLAQEKRRGWLQRRAGDAI